MKLIPRLLLVFGVVLAGLPAVALAQTAVFETMRIVNDDNSFNPAGWNVPFQPDVSAFNQTDGATNTIAVPGVTHDTHIGFHYTTVGGGDPTFGGTGVVHTADRNFVGVAFSGETASVDVTVTGTGADGTTEITHTFTFNITRHSQAYPNRYLGIGSKTPAADTYTYTEGENPGRIRVNITSDPRPATNATRGWTVNVVGDNAAAYGLPANRTGNFSAFTSPQAQSLTFDMNFTDDLVADPDARFTLSYPMSDNYLRVPEPSDTYVFPATETFPIVITDNDKGPGAPTEVTFAADPASGAPTVSWVNPTVDQNDDPWLPTRRSAADLRHSDIVGYDICIGTDSVGVRTREAGDCTARRTVTDLTGDAVNPTSATFTVGDGNELAFDTNYFVSIAVTNPVTTNEDSPDGIEPTSDLAVITTATQFQAPTQNATLELTDLTLTGSIGGGTATPITLTPSDLSTVRQEAGSMAAVTTAAYSPYTDQLTLTWMKRQAAVGGVYYDDGSGTPTLQTGSIVVSVDPASPSDTLVFEVRNGSGGTVNWTINLVREAAATPAITLSVPQDVYNEFTDDEIVVTATADPAPLGEITVRVRIARGGIGRFLAGGGNDRLNMSITLAGGETTGTATWTIDKDSTDDAEHATDSVEAIVRPGVGYVVSPSCTGTTDTSGNNEGTGCDSFTINDDPPPTAAEPVSPMVAAGNAAFTVTWMAPDSSAADVLAPTGYEVCGGVSLIQTNLATLAGNCDSGTVTTFTKSAAAGDTSLTLADSDAGITIANGQEYRVAIRSLHDDGNSDWVATTPATVSPAEPTDAEPPTGVTAVRGDVMITLTWDAPAGGVTPTGYEVCGLPVTAVDLDTSCVGDDHIEAIGSASTRTLIVTDSTFDNLPISNGVTRQFAVRTVAGSLTSAWSTPPTVATPGTGPVSSDGDYHAQRVIAYRWQ